MARGETRAVTVSNSRYDVAWWRRYLPEGEAGLADRSSAPRRCRRRTARRLERLICALRLAENLGPHGIGWRLGYPAPRYMPC
ncbi:MAG: hypothetical protein IIB28_06305 [Chloroflexi bacterium]|nr:hypothetical protein [Chloroflexota bacterium]